MNCCVCKLKYCTVHIQAYVVKKTIYKEDGEYENAYVCDMCMFNLLRPYKYFERSEMQQKRAVKVIEGAVHKWLHSRHVPNKN